MGSVPLQWRTFFYVSLQCVLLLQPPYLYTHETEKPEISAFAYTERHKERERERARECVKCTHTYIELYVTNLTSQRSKTKLRETESDERKVKGQIVYTSSSFLFSHFHISKGDLLESEES